MVQETWVQSQVASYQRLLKWYLIPPCLTLNNIRYVSRLKWSNQGKGVAPSLHLGVVAIERGAFWSPSTMVVNFNRAVGLMSKVLANGPGDRGSIPVGVIPKTFKMVLDTALLNTQHYNVRIRVKWSNSGN